MLQATDSVAGATTPLPANFTCTVPSVKLVVAVPDSGPVAVTAYVATNQSGSRNWSVIWPVAFAVTSALRSQVWPPLSLT